MLTLISPTEINRESSGFAPHAVILTARTRPQPIFVIDFDLVTSLPDARAISIRRSMEFGSNWRNSNLRSREHLRSFLISADQLAFVNYSPDRAVRFDLDGNAVEILQRAYLIGQAYLSHCKRLIPLLSQPKPPTAAPKFCNQRTEGYPCADDTRG
jgi:hypothetical protein